MEKEQNNNHPLNQTPTKNTTKSKTHNFDPIPPFLVKHPRIVVYIVFSNSTYRKPSETSTPHPLNTSSFFFSNFLCSINGISPN